MVFFASDYGDILAHSRKRSWWARRNKRLTGRIVHACMQNWDGIQSGNVTTSDIRKELVVGNPFLILIAQILIPIIIELIKRWLENRNK